MPRLSCCAPERHTNHRKVQTHVHRVKHRAADVSGNWIICGVKLFGIWKQDYLKRRVKAWKNVWKLLWWLMAVSSFSSMLPNTWDPRREGGVTESKLQNVKPNTVAIINYCSTVVTWSSNRDPSKSPLKELTGLFLNINLPLGMSILLVYNHRLLGSGDLTAVKYGMYVESWSCTSTFSSCTCYFSFRFMCMWGKTASVCIH